MSVSSTTSVSSSQLTTPTAATASENDSKTVSVAKPIIERANSPKLPDDFFEGVRDRAFQYLDGQSDFEGAKASVVQDLRDAANLGYKVPEAIIRNFGFGIFGESSVDKFRALVIGYCIRK